jgi:hypothetical protein
MDATPPNLQPEPERVETSGGNKEAHANSAEIKRYIYTAISLTDNEVYLSGHETEEEAFLADTNLVKNGNENMFIRRSITPTVFKSTDHFTEWLAGMRKRLKRAKKKATKVRKANAHAIRMANTDAYLAAANADTVSGAIQSRGIADKSQ